MAKSERPKKLLARLEKLDDSERLAELARHALGLDEQARRDDQASGESTQVELDGQAPQHGKGIRIGHIELLANVWNGDAALRLRPWLLVRDDLGARTLA